MVKYIAEVYYPSPLSTSYRWQGLDVNGHPSIWRLQKQRCFSWDEAISRTNKLEGNNKYRIVLDFRKDQFKDPFRFDRVICELTE